MKSSVEHLPKRLAVSRLFYGRTNISMKTLSRSKLFAYPAELVFQALDDLGVTGTHMTKSSGMMLGSKLKLEFLTAQHTGVGATYRWSGRMMGLQMDFTVQVVKWIPNREKFWETIGESKLTIYSWYQMRLMLSESELGTNATLSISYRKPEGLFNNILCFLFADWYCRWCLKKMLNDSQMVLARLKS